MMKLLIFLLLIVRSNGDYKHTRFMEQIPAFLTKLCPGSNICRTNDLVVYEGNVLETGALDSLNEIFGLEYGSFGSKFGAFGSEFGAFGSESSKKSCCTDCSCKSECVNTHDCCFPSIPEQPDCTSSGSPPPEELKELKRQCIYTKTGESKPSDATRFRSYYMISSENPCNTSDHKDDCGNQKVAPWGNLHPVFSNRTRKIYKNEICANAHNITDGIFWDAILACKIFDSKTFRNYDIIDFFGELESGEVSSHCHVQFSYPGDLNEISSQICYRDMINECTSTEFQVPSYLNATTEEITESCHSGLLSPYFDIERLYANVFCYICSGLSFYPGFNCLEGKFETQGVEEFQALLNWKELHVSVKVDHHKKKHLPMACSMDMLQHECRPVLCSSGKIRNDMGDCMFPAKDWYRQHYAVAIELTCEREIDMKEAFPLDNENPYVLDIDALYMASTFKLNRWSVYQLFYQTSTRLNNDTTTKILVVFMNQYFAAADPLSIMSNIALLLKIKWFLKYKNETLLLQPSPFKHKGLKTSDNSPTPGSLTVNGTVSFSVKSPDYRRIYSSKNVVYGAFLVTKLYFCEQIELVSEEYMLSADQSILYNMISHQYLFDGEFSLMYGSSEVSVRICLENSGFVKTNVVNCACAKSHLIAAFVLLVSISLATWYQPSSNEFFAL